MSRKLINLKTGITVIVLSFGLLAAVKAQQSAPLLGGSPAMNYSRELLKRKDVQIELGLDANQKDALAKVFNELPGRIIVRVVRIVPPVLSSEERKQWNAETRRQSAEQAANVLNERSREVEEVLRPDQRKRLSEIDLQWRGILALVDKNLSGKLGVSPAHYHRITEIAADFEVKRIILMDVSDNPDSARYRKRQLLLQETEQKVLALLSDEEKSRWAQAIGKPFKFEDDVK